MSYTPTTENIFDAALHGARAVSVEMSSVLNESEFRAQLDRWLAALIREAKAEALEEFAGQMATGFNPETLNAERRAIKREARTRAAEYRKAVGP